MKQETGFARTADNVNLAWAKAGQGMPLVKAANWLTHLDHDLHNNVWGHWTRFLAENFSYLRYDERGCGVSQWATSKLDQSTWPDDLEAVIKEAKPAKPFALLGISQGAATAVLYAHRHPEQVSHLILYGGYARGAYKRGDTTAGIYKAMSHLAIDAWNSTTKSYRYIFTSRFVPGADQEKIEWFNDLCRKTTTAEIAAQLLEARAEVDVSELLPELKVPTLVIHAIDDEVVPFSEGRYLASHIPGADFLPLDSANHIILEEETVWPRLQAAILEFTGQGASREAFSFKKAFASLSARETQIVAALCEGHDNEEIADRLGLSGKTVRNHVSNILSKTNTRNRLDLVVKALK